MERHGAIRVGTPQELSTLRRLFAVMGMEPRGLLRPVGRRRARTHLLRPVSDAALLANPFRVFTSLLRLELIADPALRQQASDILARRNIFTPEALALIARAEADGGLNEPMPTALCRLRWKPSAGTAMPR